MDGVAASQAIDSSGEILDVEGCDISSLPVDGTINYEHISGDDGKVAPGEETVGRILYAHKIFGPEDCRSEREEHYWDLVRCPYIYIVYRLFDGAGHRGAQALAASIRDALAHGDKILVRLSIEGATLERDGNRLKSSVARRVSATYKPCNRVCDVGLISDPNAPPGFDKQPVPVKDLPRGVLKSEGADPGLRRLGGALEIEGDPLLGERQLAQYLVAKALTAGGTGGAAPSALTAGSALQVEDRSLRGRMRRTLATYKSEHRFDRARFIAHAKAELPEASDDFLSHFANVAEDLHLRRGALHKAQAARDGVWAHVRKFEALAVDLRKAQADLELEAKPPVQFAGHTVHPGRAVTGHGNLALLHEDATHFTAVPEDKVSDWDVDDLVRLPKAKANTHYRVEARPMVPVASLE